MSDSTAEETEDAKNVTRNDDGSATFTFDPPVPMGKGRDPVESITLRPTPYHFKTFEMPMAQDGTMLFRPYPMALLGLHMGGRPANDEPFLNKMSSEDMRDLAQLALSFYARQRTVGKSPLPK